MTNSNVMTILPIRIEGAFAMEEKEFLKTLARELKWVKVDAIALYRKARINGT